MGPLRRAWNRSALLSLLAAGLCLGAPGRAEDAADKLRVSVEGLEGELRANALAFLGIERFDGKAAPSVERLRWLHQQAEEELRRALQPFGYYRPHIDSSLEHDAAGWRARYRVVPGEPVRIASLRLELAGEARQDPAYQRLLANPPLRQGEVLVHARYEQLKSELQSLAAERGYFDARLVESRVRVDLAAYRADVMLRFDSGPRYRLGEVRFSDTPLDPDLLRRYLTLEPGEPYQASRLLELQSDLIASEYFEQVMVNASPDQAGPDRTLPVTVDLEMRKRNLYTFGLGYGTDTGMRGKASVERRWINRRGHRLKGEMLASQIKQNLSAEYIIPGADPRTDSYNARIGYQAEDSDVKDSQTALLGVSYVRQDGKWRKTLSLDYLWEKFKIGEDEQESKLLLPGAQWSRVEADDRLFVTRGYRLDLSLRGAYEPLLADVSFLQARMSGKWVVPLWAEGRMLLRGDLGTTWVVDDADFQRIPTSLRFYAGGDNSVRGYSLDSIGPRDAEGEVVGGRHLLVGSLEYEHRIAEKWSMAAFVDAGDAFDSATPELKTGVGLGVRWRSPVGPVRVDLASGLDEPGDSVRLHLTIGPDL
ncbi:MAG TPA: autotransporter assembly complex family protein [Candidatus Competibacteraceae bacterium]|nr:autotransporter assembly complex family protein [Candidatus Competibacteraceae bacterium]